MLPPIPQKDPTIWISGSVTCFFNPSLTSENQYYVLAPRQKSGKGRQWGSSDLPRVTLLGSV